MTCPFESLPDNLAAFCEVLRRDYRFHIGPGELQDAVRALEQAELFDQRAVRNVLRPVLAGRFQELRVFDHAFQQFFGSREPAPVPHTAGSQETTGEARTTTFEEQSPARAAGAETFQEETADEGDGQGAVLDVSDTESQTYAILRASYSPLHAEGAVPDLEPPDRAWREAAAALVSRVRAGVSRRWRPALRGQRFDLRRTLRVSLHTGGEVLMPRWRARPRRRPRFVMLIDGSRSMGVHTEPALKTAVALAAVTLKIETFTFSTALRRVTRDVRRAAAGERRHLHLHHAWGGGTTIGACLSEFLHRFGERVLGRDTVVIVSSDGLDVGDATVLREAMARLARLSASIVWLNPLLETPGYEPTALGMSVARPFVTTFASVGDAAGLARLARLVRIR